MFQYTRGDKKYTYAFPLCNMEINGKEIKLQLSNNFDLIERTLFEDILINIFFKYVRSIPLSFFNKKVNCKKRWSNRFI